MRSPVHIIIMPLPLSLQEERVKDEYPINIPKVLLETLIRDALKSTNQEQRRQRK